VLLVNLLAALNFANSKKFFKNVWKIKNVKKRKKPDHQIEHVKKVFYIYGEP